MSILSHNKYSFDTTSEKFFINKLPILLWITAVYVLAVTFQNMYSPLILNSVIVGGFILTHILLYWFGDSLISKNIVLYFAAQTAVIFAAVFILKEGSAVLLIGLLPILIAQSMIVLKKIIQIVLVFSFLYSQYSVAIILIYGVKELAHYILIFIAILLIISFYYIMYNRQVNERIRMKYYLSELEMAHRKVEELTLVNERQRMARDLHDTLAQGLAGLIMQLEAIDSHMKNENTVRAQEIIGKAMAQARKTMRDSRTAIDNLREKSISKMDFQDAVKEEITRFSDATPIEIESEIENVFPLNNFVREHSLYIISEGLANIAKHSKATKAKVLVKKENHHLNIEIEDNGIGISNLSISQHGKYGLRGLQERVRLIGGQIRFESKPNQGTKIVVSVPLEQKEKSNEI
ncbi:sensor histidine kinase [Priestia endophytica]|uniref:sensor histidine kinase n=1 Tax=Priestia endophytica TaxID=135735 RepID=UPI002281B72C|nr:sensor histidine kinase [Priestia endophytica]MCY8235328.1 sensor histidine kinase [Priestia endophytica]